MAKEIGNMKNTGSKMEASINAMAQSGLGKLDIDANNYKPDTEGYKSEMGGIWDKYASMSANQLQSIQQQTALRQQQLQKELEINKQKYQIDHDRNVNVVNQQHKQANDEIAQNRYDNLDYSNQMGAMRGVSSSAQQTAMDNGVYRHATKLFNDNTETRNQALNDLSYRLQSLNLELDMGYSKDMTGLAINQMQQQSQIEQQMAGQYLQHATATTNQVFNMLDKHNDRLFSTDMEKAKTQQSVNMFLAQLYAEDAKMADQFSRDLEKMATQHSYNKDMASFQHGLSMQMAEYQNKLAMQRDSANRRASASSSSSAKKADNDKYEKQKFEDNRMSELSKQPGMTYQDAKAIVEYEWANDRGATNQYQDPSKPSSYMGIGPKKDPGSKTRTAPEKNNTHANSWTQFYDSMGIKNNSMLKSIGKRRG